LTELVTRNDLEVLRRELQTAMDNLSLRLTVRLGIMFAAGLTLLGALLTLLATMLKLHG
jgi:hypothetical protein